MTTAAVSLIGLVDAGLSIELNGRSYPVRPIDGFGYQLVASMEGVNSVEVMYRVAARCLAPGMTRDEVFGTEDTQGLTAAQVGAVVQLASGQVNKVEASASPNSEPAGKREARTNQAG